MPATPIANLFEETREDAEEVFLLMNGNARVSRNVRAQWFFDHLGKKLNKDAEEREEEISVVGMIPKYGDKTTDLRVSKNTTLTYFSNSYRMVFVMDLSPSTFATGDGEEVCYSRIFNIVKDCLGKIVKQFVFPGSTETFCPKIFVTFCAFSPFLCFTDDCVLLQGIQLTEENLHLVLTTLEAKFTRYINNLCTYFQPYIRHWASHRRVFRRFAKCVEAALYSTTDAGAGRATKTVEQYIADYRPRLTDTSCPGFVHPDWSLIAMLRMGLLGVQMLGPDIGQSNLILVTDGCCAIPEGPALEQVISQLRAYTITCTFIQSDLCVRGAALGYVSFPELFKFIAASTFGRFMLASDLPTVEDNGQMNFYHRAFFTWRFQEAVVGNSLTSEYSRGHMETTRSHQCSQQYKTSMNKLLHVRLHEGYTIRDVNHFSRDGKDMLKVHLSLSWKPNVTLEYVVVTRWHRNFQKTCKISVDFYVETASGVPCDLYVTSGQETLQETIEGFVQVDSLLVHIQMFNQHPAYYKLPRDLAKKVPFFELRHDRIYIGSTFDKPKYREFAQFWLPICVINESMWRKWVHIYTMRIVLIEDDPLPRRVFTRSESSSEFSQIQCKEAGRQVLELFNQRSTFVLLKDQCFVNFLSTSEQPAPQYFYVTKIQYDSPCMIIKLAFVGGMSTRKRMQVINQLRSELTSLNMIRSTSIFAKVTESLTESSPRIKQTSIIEKQSRETVVRLVNPVESPIERILIRYSRVPTDIANIVRLEDTSNEISVREMIMHNAVAKYLSCRRTVWELKPTFPCLDVASATIEFILQLIVKRRLHQGFNIAYGANGIVGMIRQVGDVSSDSVPPRIQQRETNEYSGYIDAIKREEARRRPKSWPRIVTEMWLEPQNLVSHSYNEHISNQGQDVYDPERETREELLKEDDAIIRAIFTFDQLMRAAEFGLYKKEAFVLNKVAGVLTGETLSDSVHLYKDVFDPKALMDNADTREFMLLPGLGCTGGEDNIRVDARLESLLKYVQAELMRYCDCCVDALDDAFLWDIVETCENHFGINRFFAPENWSFGAGEETGDEQEDDIHERKSAGSKFLIQSINERNKLRQGAASNGGSSAESRVYSPSECLVDEEEDDEEERVFNEVPPHLYDISSLSQPYTSFQDTDPYKAAVEAADAALSNLNAELELQQRANSISGMASDSDENNIIYEDPHGCIEEKDGPNDQVPDSFVTRDLLNEFDEAIAFSSSSIHETLAHSSSSNSSTSGGDSPKEDGGKGKRQEDKHSSAIETKPGRKTTGERLRNSSGATERKMSREERNLSDKAEKSSHVQPQPDINVKNEAIKKFPPIPLGGFGLYARRVGNHRMVLFFVPKNAKTVRLLMPHCVNSFPVFVYFADKLRMAQRFVEKRCEQPGGSKCSLDIRTVVEDFTQKARVSTLAFLNQQVHEHYVSESEHDSMDREPAPLEEFYLRALDSAQLRAELEPIKFQLSDFDLKKYAEKVFEEYMFTKAFIAAAFSSIGQSVDVPRSVLKEATEYRCEYVSLELGSIQSIIRNSCLHLQLYEKLPNKFTSSSSNLDPISVQPVPTPETIKQLNSRRFFRLANGCVSNFNDFAACFDRLLQVHSFKPVPGLPDYYFFWPYRKTVLRFANVDDVSIEFADVFRAIGDQPTTTDVIVPSKYGQMTGENRLRSESGSRILAEARNATQLSAADMWPLFIQFSIGIIGADGEMETSSFSSIPNCLKELTNICSTRPLQLQTEGLTGQGIKVSVDLYILTWPLPQQSPFKLNDPHLVHARYQETQAKLSALNKYPARRREFILKMAEKERRKKRRRKACTSSSSEESESVDFWTVGGSSTCSSDDSSEHGEDTFESSGMSDDEDEPTDLEDMLLQDERDLLSPRNRPIDEIRREEHSKKVFDFLSQLPKGEQYAVKRLQASVQRMLTAEKLFEWARRCEGQETPQPTDRLLSVICQFVNKVAPPDNQPFQIAANVCSEAIYNSFKRSITFTGDHVDGIKRLCDRLTNLRIEYVRLRRYNPDNACIDDSTLYDEEDEYFKTIVESSGFSQHSDSTIFYACFVDNFDAFKEFYSYQLLTVDNPLDAYKEPPTTPPPTTVGLQSSPPTATTPDGALTPKKRRRSRATSLSPTFEKRKSLQALNLEISSSDIDSSSGDDVTVDFYEPLKDAPNNAYFGGDPAAASQPATRKRRRSSLKRQIHHSSSNDSLHNCGFCSDGGEAVPSPDHLKRRQSSSKSRDKTPEAIVGSEGTIVAEDHRFGESIQLSPVKSTKGEEEEVEMRNGFPLKWLISCGIYKDGENQYVQKLEPFLHDFWLIFHVEHSPRASPEVTIHFLRRHNSPHTQLSRDALRILDEQVHRVNQELLLDRMHNTEECDQLLIDNPDASDEPRSIHRRITFYVKDKSGKLHSRIVPCADESERSRREKSTMGSDEESTIGSELLQQARFKYPPGHFACDSVWYHWFEIHPRLQSPSRFASGSIDLGFQTLQFGLERFSVKNRTNLYVFREQKTENVVYLRLFPNDPKILEQFNKFPYRNRPDPPPDSRPHSHVLLAVHGVEKPSDEITELLLNVLEKKLNARILKEIQDVLVKNVHARLEISDVRFIQQDHLCPTNVIYYALPAAVNQILTPLTYYFEQQALLFCITPRVREQGGATSFGPGSSTHRSNTPKSPNPSRLCPSSSLNTEQAFLSYPAQGSPKNPEDYAPMLFLLNIPPSEGRRDIGLACVEVKFIDTTLSPVGRPPANNLLEMSKQLEQHMLTSRLNGQQRFELFNLLTKIRRVKSPYGQEKTKEASPTSFVQFAIWQNGGLNSEELDTRFRICVQQSLCDLYTELGILSMKIFDVETPNEASARSAVSTVSNALQPQLSIDLTSTKSDPMCLDATGRKMSNISLDRSGGDQQQIQMTTDLVLSPFVDKAASDLDLYSTATACHTLNEDSLPTAKQSVRPLVAQTSLRAATSDKNLDSTVSSSIDDLIPSSTSMRPTRISSIGTQIPSSVYMALSTARRSVMTTMAGKMRNDQEVPPLSKIAMVETGEYLRDDFAMSAANWLDFMATLIAQKDQQLASIGLSNVSSDSGVLKKFTFALDCDRAMRKVMQVVFDRICLGLLGERCVCACRPRPSSTSGPRRLQLLWNAASLSENTEKDYGRVLGNTRRRKFKEDATEQDPEIYISLLAYNEKEYEESLKYIQHQETSRIPDSLNRLCSRGSREAQLQFFLPHKDPFIPRKRLLYVVARNDILTLFIYNYSTEQCEMAREIVEKTVLWHNTRSRLLCDIGLHKLGMTHLSALKDERNPYHTLTWMDPETLVRHDYPPIDLKMPDFSKIPKNYAQLLFKIFRFSEPAFVAKNFAVDPFDDQTQQLMTLREEVKSKLNDHRVFSDIHRRMMEGKDDIHEDVLLLITARAHVAHFVQSPLLLFTSWRFKIATIRSNIGNKGTTFEKGQVVEITPKHGCNEPRPIQLSPVPVERKKRAPSTHHLQYIPPPKSSYAEIQQVHGQETKHLMLAAEPPKAKTRAKTTVGAQHSLKQYLKRPNNFVMREPQLPPTPASGKALSALCCRIPEQELCLLKVQYMLMAEYVDYLQTTGWTLLKIYSSYNTQLYNLQYTPECTTSPHAWLYVARPGGIIFAYLTFVEPYFSVQFLFWNVSQLNDRTITEQQPGEMEAFQEIELLKNELIQKSHVHSFCYDFHLRMVSKYLTGGTPVLFNPGYNTNAFMIDFLRYYGCRPPYARDCVYEERAVFQPFRVKGTTIWDYFLSNDQHFGWNVVRLKITNNREESDDEYMLIAKEQREIAPGQAYQLICMVLKVPTTAGSKTNALENQLELKLYVLMVSDDIKYPLPDIFVVKDENGEKPGTGGDIVACSAPSPLTIDDPKKRVPVNEGIGGEFTRIERKSLATEPEEEKEEDKKKEASEDLKPPGNHIFRIQSFGGGMNEQMLDELIKMSTTELMDDVGFSNPPSVDRKKTRLPSSKCRRSEPGEDKISPSFRRRAASSDDVSAHKSLRELSQLRRKKTEQENQAGDLQNISIRSSSSDANILPDKGDNKGRNSDFPMKKPLGGSLTRLDYHYALNNVWNQSSRATTIRHGLNGSGSTNTTGSSTGVSIEKVPPRRHRQTMTNIISKTHTDTVLSPEQVTYVYYLSNQQRRLQHLLEESARIKKSELEAFVLEAERICYVDELWKSLLSSKSSFTRPNPKTFSASLSKSESSAEAPQTSKIPQIEMNPTDFDALMDLVCVESLLEEEPRLREALSNVNFAGLCAFLAQHYEKDKIYRYFERQSWRYFIVLNPSYLDSALMLRDDTTARTVELFILFKNTDTELRKKQFLTSSAIHEQFEKLMNYITTYLWVSLLQDHHQDRLF